MLIDPLLIRARALATLGATNIRVTEEEMSYVPSNLDISALATVEAAERAALVRQAITAEFSHRISAALGGVEKQASMQREAAALLRKAVLKIQMTQIEIADAALLDAVNTWETAMVETREALIAAENLTAATADETWPLPPSGITHEWLAGF